MARAEWFDASVTLPSGLTRSAIGRSVEYIERELSGLVDIYYEQMNVFSALVSIFGAKGLDSFSDYEKHRHSDTAQQRFPDLIRRGSGPELAPEDSLESKASKRPWALQSHFDHPGWYVVWRYLVDPIETLQPGVSVITWRVDVAFIEKSDWKYQGSGAGPSGGGRTHTFGLYRPATKLAGSAADHRGDVVLARGKPVPLNGDQH